MGRNRKKCWYQNPFVANERTYDSYLSRLLELNMISIKWNNIPPTCNERYLEQTLMRNGAAIFFKDEVLGYLCLPLLMTGPLDIYGEPIIREAFSPTNGYRARLDETNSVIIYNNFLKSPSINTLELYAWRMYEAQRTIDVNIKGQKTPHVIGCPESQRLTFINMVEEYDGNVPFILGSKNLDLDAFKHIDITVPFISDKVKNLQRETWRDALEYIGIYVAQNYKKERQSETEVEANTGGVEAARLTRLTPREQACEQINEMFGLDLSVEFRSEMGKIGFSEYDTLGGGG